MQIKLIFDIPSCSNILSHSSRIKCFKCFKFNFLLRIRAKIRPGVPTTMCGFIDLSVSSSFCIGNPPKNTPTFWENINNTRNYINNIIKKKMFFVP